MLQLPPGAPALGVPFENQVISLRGVDGALPGQRVQADRMVRQRCLAETGQQAECSRVGCGRGRVRDSRGDELMQRPAPGPQGTARGQMDFAGQNGNAAIATLMDREQRFEERPPFSPVRPALPLIAKIVFIISAYAGSTASRPRSMTTAVRARGRWLWRGHDRRTLYRCTHVAPYPETAAQRHRLRGKRRFSGRKLRGRRVCRAHQQSGQQQPVTVPAAGK